MPPRRRRAAVALAAVAIALAPAVLAGRPALPSPESLARRAAVIVEAEVAAVETAIDPATGRLATYVGLRVEAYHRGGGDARTLVLRQPGGVFGRVVHAVDGVPRWRQGSRVLAFLEPAADGALRPSALASGVFVLDGSRGGATRDVEGAGLLRAAARAPRAERWSRRDLLAAAAAVANPSPPPWRTEPPEYARLVRPGDPGAPELARRALGGSTPLDLADATTAGTAASRFTLVAPATPLRRPEVDDGVPVVVGVDVDGAPWSDPDGTRAAVAAALAAWSDAPESRLLARAADDDLDWQAVASISPAAAAGPVDAVLFGDPYDDLGALVNCSGTLAIGGVWGTAASGTTVNGVEFLDVTRSYVVVNAGVECALDSPADLAELLAHELGHALGLGHSAQADALMQPWMWHQRGPRLGGDDLDAIHCVYPHALRITAPAEGETVTAGDVVEVAWSASPETGPDPGTVTLEWSADGGASWLPAVADTPQDGAESWLVPDLPTDDARVRLVRPPRTGANPAGWPGACTEALSPAFAIVAPPPPAPGAIAAGSLRVDRAPGGDVRLSWEPGCGDAPDGHAVYAGSLAELRGGLWHPTAATCAAGADLVEWIDAGPGDRYFLVAPASGGLEGGLGAASDGTPRPPADAACAPRAEQAACADPSSPRGSPRGR